MRKSPKRYGAAAKRVSPAKAEAVRIFSAWRAAGYAMKVSRETAMEITFNTVAVETETINLSTLAVKYAIHTTREARR